MEDNFKYLAHFLGPKGENSDFFLKNLKTIFQDYIHWRRNYYPPDKNISSNIINREFSNELDGVENDLLELLAQLRRNFPFYSPRYIAHMLSDITIPSALGYFAGMLYNGNNVTPEAAPVTVEMEIEGCNEILKMIGYKPSPVPPNKNAKIEDWNIYERELKTEFGWAHLTSGGTVANIEALWVAKLIKYFPLSVFDISAKHNLDIEIKNPKGELKNIRDFSLAEIVNIKPNESIYLLAKYVEAVQKKFRLDLGTANKKASSLLSESKYSLTGNVGKMHSDFPAVIFASGAAHYCIKKAADILGIGRDNVILVKTDSSFRLDIQDLEFKIKESIKRNEIPLAVIGVAGTTEEGAVDPIHEILELRKKFEKELNISFWVHVDAAWGGYVASIFNLEEIEEVELIFNKIFNKLKIPYSNFHEELNTKFNSLDIYIDKKFNDENLIILEEITKAEERILELVGDENIATNISATFFDTNYCMITEEQETLRTQILNQIESKEVKELLKHREGLIKRTDYLKNFWGSNKNYFGTQKYNKFFGGLKELFLELGLYNKNSNDSKLLNDRDFKIDIYDRVDSTYEYVKDKLDIEYKTYKKEREIRWGAKESVFPYFAFSKADSVTIDPHKMGYMQYPIGVIAFRNDRIRHFITQRAPYITSKGQNALLHTPPRHVEGIEFDKLSANKLPYENYSVAIDAFAPFMLEGSKPGAAAASLWLASKSIPLNRRNHGRIVRASLIATRELYEWLKGWSTMIKFVNEDSVYYDFKLISPDLPDLNLVIFVVKANAENSLNKLNKLSKLVYDSFTIQAELGDRDHSYSQPFFLSKTTFTAPEYHFDSLKKFFIKTFPDADINEIKKEYMEQGLLVLRATLMNPYITPLKTLTNQNFIKEFVIDLHKASNKSVKAMIDIA